MNFERKNSGWVLVVGNVRICYNRNIESKYKLYRGYSGWVLSCGRIIIGTL